MPAPVYKQPALSFGDGSPQWRKVPVAGFPENWIYYNGKGEQVGRAYRDPQIREERSAFSSLGPCPPNRSIELFLGHSGSKEVAFSKVEQSKQVQAKL
jgi:hypothetical protein